MDADASVGLSYRELRALSKSVLPRKKVSEENARSSRRFPQEPDWHTQTYRELSFEAFVR